MQRDQGYIIISLQSTSIYRRVSNMSVRMKARDCFWYQLIQVVRREKQLVKGYVENAVWNTQMMASGKGNTISSNRHNNYNESYRHQVVLFISEMHFYWRRNTVQCYLLFPFARTLQNITKILLTLHNWPSENFIFCFKTNELVLTYLSDTQSQQSVLRPHDRQC